MYGKMLNTIINIMFITYLLLLVSFYFLHEGIKENINNINYETIDSVATTGIFNVETYNNLKEKIFNYSGKDCDYILTIKYEKKVSPGVYDTYFIKDKVTIDNLTYDGVPQSVINTTVPTSAQSAAADAIGEDRKIYAAKENKINSIDPDHIITDTERKQLTPMYKGDKLTIYLEDQNQTLYGKLITTPFMGMMDNYVDFRIKSLKSVMIGRDANKLYSGYEVIDEINDGGRSYKIEVTTEMSNGVAAVYNPSSKYSDSNANCGYDPASGTVGKNHIFNSVYYYRIWDNIDGDNTLSAGDIVYYYQTVQ